MFMIGINIGSQKTAEEIAKTLNVSINIINEDLK